MFQIKFLHLWQIFYVFVVTLSTEDNAKLLPQSKSAFKRTISWNKYQPKSKLLRRNINLNRLIEPSFQIVNRLFILAFEDDAQRTSSKRYYLPNVEIKDHNVMMDGKNFFDQPVKNNEITYENIRNIATGQGDNYTTSCLLDYIYYKNYYEMTAVDLSKQQALDADTKAIQQINFTANFDRDGDESARFSFFLEEAKETVFEFSQETVKVFMNAIVLGGLIFMNIKMT